MLKRLVPPSPPKKEPHEEWGLAPCQGLALLFSNDSTRHVEFVSQAAMDYGLEVILEYNTDILTGNEDYGP